MVILLISSAVTLHGEIVEAAFLASIGCSVTFSINFLVLCQRSFLKKITYIIQNRVSCRLVIGTGLHNPNPCSQQKNEAFFTSHQSSKSFHTLLYYESPFWSPEPCSMMGSVLCYQNVHLQAPLLNLATLLLFSSPTESMPLQSIPWVYSCHFGKSKSVFHLAHIAQQFWKSLKVVYMIVQRTWLHCKVWEPLMMNGESSPSHLSTKNTWAPLHNWISQQNIGAKPRFHWVQQPDHIHCVDTGLGNAA